MSSIEAASVVLMWLGGVLM